MMIRINNTNWEELKLSDIEAFLREAEAESIFFDNKDDKVNNDKITKEVCAFANTFGGYIFIGVRDDNTIEGCAKWTEERVHNVVHDTITPTPIIDIKKISTEQSYILIIRIEEGDQSPYVTNSGKIYERLSSGSYPVKDSSKLEALYHKKEIHERRVYKKIEALVPSVHYEAVNNLVGCIDVGVSITTSSRLDFEESFYSADLSEIAHDLAQINNSFTISRIGPSIQITYGEVSSDSKRVKLLEAGLNNYFVIYADGSFYYRIMICSDEDSERADITGIYFVVSIFEKIYKALIGDDIEKKYIYAEKYQRLHVFRQFVPYYSAKHFGDSEYFEKYHDNHISKYGGNKTVAGVRYPFEGYKKYDKRSFEKMELPFSNDQIVEVLAGTIFLNLGYIDIFEMK